MSVACEVNAKPARRWPRVVGVLIEVPVMLLVARIVIRSRAWYERGVNVPATEAV